jgi:TolB protein
VRYVHGSIPHRAVTLCSLLIAACSGGDSQAPGADGAARFISATTGVDPDPDGYAVSVDGGPATTVGGSDTVVVGRLAPGTHGLAVTGVAPNCALAPSTTTSFTVTAGDTTDVALAITCAGPGQVRVTVTTTGLRPDTGGYSLSEDGGAGQAIGPSQTITISDVPSGDHTFAIGDIAANCAVAGSNPLTVTVAAGATTAASFSVHCLVAGHIVFDINGDLLEVLSDGSGQTALTSGPAIDGGAAWSRDGTRVAFESDRMGGGIFVMNADGSGIARVTTDPSDGSPTWSPDGSRLAFQSRRDNNLEIYAVNLDGSNLVRLTTNPGPDETPAWSPDGTVIVFTRGIPGSAHLYTMHPDGGNVTPLTDGEADVSPSWSPDGSRIAFRGTGSGGGTDILTINADGTDPKDLTNNGGFNFDPSWSPDGLALAYVSEVGGSQEVWVMNVDGSGQTRITHNSTFTGRTAWGP